MKRFVLVVSCLLLGGAVGLMAGRSGLQGQPGPVPAAVPPVPKELTSYRHIVKRVLPAVVSIEAYSARARRPAREEDMQKPGDFGSGFLVDDKGTVVTNFHVVADAEHVVVHLADGRKFTSKDFKSDRKTDLAIIRLKAPAGLPYLEFGDSNGMEIGDRVLAIGAPFGLTGSVTHGIISAKGRSLRMNMYEDFLQTDAAINPGNSGGPLINLEGKVIGINSAIKSRSGGFQGVGLAISSNLGKRIVNTLLKDGVVRRGYLGVQIRDVDTEALAKRLGMTEAKGVLVTKAFEDAPGARGGLKSGDVILRIGDRDIKDGRELQTVVAALPIGKPVEVKVFREGAEKGLKITVEEQPTTFGTSRLTTPPRLPEVGKGALAVPKVGVEVADLTVELADTLGYPLTTRGALITKVSRDGLADAEGVRPGLLITSVNGKVVGTARAARDAIQAASTATGVRLRLMGPSGASAEVVLRARE